MSLPAITRDLKAGEFVKYEMGQTVLDAWSKRCMSPKVQEIMNSITSDERALIDQVLKVQEAAKETSWVPVAKQETPSFIGNASAIFRKIIK